MRWVKWSVHWMFKKELSGSDYSENLFIWYCQTLKNEEYVMVNRFRTLGLEWRRDQSLCIGWNHLKLFIMNFFNTISLIHENKSLCLRSKQKTRELIDLKRYSIGFFRFSRVFLDDHGWTLWCSIKSKIFFQI